MDQLRIAKEFVHEFRVYFDEDTQSFWIYEPTSGRFLKISEAKLRWKLVEFITALAGKEGAEAFIATLTSSKLGAVLQLGKGIPLDVGSPPSAGPLIHVANGMVDLSSGKAKLLPFDSSYRSTRTCPFKFDPKAKCERFLKELLEPALSADDVSLLQRIFGAALVGRNDAQRLSVITGASATGKTTAENVLEGIIGVENVAHLRTDHLASRFETYAYLHKTLLAAKDVPADFLTRRGAKMLKALVGDDQLEAEQKFGGKHRLRGDLNVIVTSNSRLRVTLEGDAEAWRRRLLLLEFNRQFPAKRVANFAEVLLHEEGEGILAWMVEGAVQHLAELERCGDYELTEAQQARIDALLQESDSVAEFVRVGISNQAGAQVTVEELKSAYFEYCVTKKFEPVSERQFENAASKLVSATYGVAKRNDLRRKRGWARGYKGLALAVPILTAEAAIAQQ
jgi:P4 family phage/plasmid primase-like protien